MAIVSLTAWGAACAFAGCGGDDTTGGSSSNNDSGVDSSTDSGTKSDSSTTDSGKADSSATDSGSTDSGATDSGSTDSGSTDSGSADSGDAGSVTDAGDAGDGATTLSFATDIYPILQTECVTCHTIGGGAKAGLLVLGLAADGGPVDAGDAGDGGDAGFVTLVEPDEALAYANLVNRAAEGNPAADLPDAATGLACNTLGGDGGTLADGAAPLLRVKPSDHASSLLWNKVESREADGGAGSPICGAGMPLLIANLPPLSQANVDKIAEWIDQGAKP